MITGIHGLFYSSQAEELRSFIRDKLELPFTDVGDGWLIFDIPSGDLGVHPTGDGGPASGTHDISFFTDDLQATVEELKGRGVEFDGEIADHGYGFVTYLVMPGGLRVQLYQPKYEKKAGARPKAAKKERKEKQAKQAKLEAPKPKKSRKKGKAKKPEKPKGKKSKGKKSEDKKSKDKKSRGKKKRR